MSPIVLEHYGRIGPASLDCLRRLRRGLRGGLSELRFSAWLARVHLRAGRLREALGAPLETLRRGVLAFGSPRVSSAFALAPEVSVHADGFELTSQLAWRGGRALEGSRLVRRFLVDGEGLVVEEQLEHDGGAADVRYQLPPQARDAALAEGKAAYRLG